jgi:hypothetical protein
MLTAKRFCATPLLRSILRPTPGRLGAGVCLGIAFPYSRCYCMSLMLLRDTHFLLFVIVNSAASFRFDDHVYVPTLLGCAKGHASGERKSLLLLANTLFITCSVVFCLMGFMHGVQAGWSFQATHHIGVLFSVTLGWPLDLGAFTRCLLGDE